MIRRFNPLYALLPMTVMLGACTTDSDESVDPVTDPTPGFYATFRPDLALMPFPNDIWRNGSTDGTLNIYAGNERFQSDPLIDQIEQMNLLDGFGLNSVIHADFNEPLAEESLALGQTVFVFAVAVGGNPVPPALVTTFDVGVGGFQGGESVVELDPTAPLDPLTTYAVFLTNGIQSASGDDAQASASFQAMLDAFEAGEDDLGDETLNAIYAGMVQPLLAAADPLIGAENVVLAWTFTTQSTTSSLDLLSATAEPQANAFVPMQNPENGEIFTAGDLIGSATVGQNADVYAGVIEMPYYLSTATPAEDEDFNLLNSYWEADAESPLCQGAIAMDPDDDVSTPSASTTVYCPAPVVQTTITVPVLLTVPNVDSGCPGIGGVTIFQHGITQNRTNLLPVAGALAQACHAGIAIDLPLHGITDTTSGLYATPEGPLYAALTQLDGPATGIDELVAALTEQTFNLDIDEEEGIDPSGEYFINLESPITARDALRQAAANLIHLTRSIPTIDYNIAVDGGASGADFAEDPANPGQPMPVRFVGHSLGGITGTTYLGVDATADAAVLVAPGGDVADLILASETIYPEVEAGLAENNLVPGMRFFDEFFRNAQTLIEAGDPINYAAAANASHNILMMEVVGGAGNATDQVVPNTATERLADAMGLDVITTTTATGNVDGLVQFSAGDHGSLLNPAASAQATQEMQSQMANYVGSGGDAVVITDTSVIAQ